MSLFRNAAIRLLIVVLANVSLPKTLTSGFWNMTKFARFVLKRCGDERLRSLTKEAQGTGIEVHPCTLVGIAGVWTGSRRTQPRTAIKII